MPVPEGIFTKEARKIINWVLATALFVGAIVWTVSSFLYNDKAHEKTQDFSVKRISNRDSLYQVKMAIYINHLLLRSENDSNDLAKIKDSQCRMIASLAYLIRQQKGNPDTIVNRLLKLYGTTPNPEKKKLIALVLKKEYQVECRLEYVK
jgi:hypothetical protein